MTIMTMMIMMKSSMMIMTMTMMMTMTMTTMMSMIRTMIMTRRTMEEEHLGKEMEMSIRG